MKMVLKKISQVLRKIFGLGITAALLVGGLTFFGYVAALIIGGEVATQICTVIYKNIFPVIIKTSSIMVLLGLVVMYLNGEMALTASKKKNVKHEGET